MRLWSSVSCSYLDQVRSQAVACGCGVKRTFCTVVFYQTMSCCIEVRGVFLSEPHDTVWSKALAEPQPPRRLAPISLSAIGALQTGSAVPWKCSVLHCFRNASSS